MSNIQNITSNNDFPDLGFGAEVARGSKERLLNRDGTFNVVRDDLSGIAWLKASPYHAFITMSWPKFLGLIAAFNLVTNTIFAILFWLCGPKALQGPPILEPYYLGAHDVANEFLRAFFFSVQTLATIGYGHIHPIGLAANLLVTVESIIGLAGFAIIAGILFARFSRPTAAIIYSDKAVVAPYRGITAFEFRTANARRNQLIEVQAQVLFTRLTGPEENRRREFIPLELERRRVTFFALSWTIVHPIDEKSPLYGLTEQDLRESDAEFLILLTGIDETFSQTVHSRSSYKPNEIVWGARFASIFVRSAKHGVMGMDLNRIHDIDRDN